MLCDLRVRRAPEPDGLRNESKRTCYSLEDDSSALVVDTCAVRVSACLGDKNKSIILRDRPVIVSLCSLYTVHNIIGTWRRARHFYLRPHTDVSLLIVRRRFTNVAVYCFAYALYYRLRVSMNYFVSNRTTVLRLRDNCIE